MRQKELGVRRLVLWAVLPLMLVSYGSVFAETVSDYANILQSTFKSDRVVGVSKGWLSSDCNVTYTLNQAKNEMTISLSEKQLGGFSLAGLYVFITDTPDSLIFGRYKVLETKLLENSEKRLIIQSKTSNADLSDVKFQKFSFDKTTNLVTVSLTGFGSYQCQL